MKKILAYFCAFALVFGCCFGLIGCKNKDKSVIRLNEVTHSVFYAPLYLAMNLGYFEDENITIKLVNGGGSNVSMSALLSNSADIALLGPETVCYVASQGSTNHPMIFGQLTKRDGSFLVSRKNEPNFNWNNLKDKTVIAGRKGGLPAMTFEYVVNNLGLTNGNNITLDTSTAFNMMVPTFESGKGDYCTMFEPTASEYVAAGKGYIVASVGEYSGEIPYTCFMAMPKYIKKNPEKIKGFLRAVSKAYTYLMTKDSEEVAKALSKSFDGSSIASLKIAVESYKKIDAWMSSPAMTEASFNKLLTVLKNAGELSGKTVEFKDVVDNSFALELVS